MRHVSENTRRSPLRSALLITLAVLGGIGTYVLVVMVLWNHSTSAPRATAQQSGVLEPVRADFNLPPGQAPPAVYEQPTCWDVKTPDLVVGEAGEMKLDINTCPPADLPNEIAVNAESSSPGISIAGPVHTERSRTGQSWTWRVTAKAAGPHDVSVFVESVDLIGLNGQIPATITVQAGNANDHKSGLMQAISSGGVALNSLAAGVGSIVTSVGTIVALRRSRPKTS